MAQVHISRLVSEAPCKNYSSVLIISFSFYSQLFLNLYLSYGYVLLRGKGPNNIRPSSNSGPTILLENCSDTSLNCVFPGQIKVQMHRELTPTSMPRTRIHTFCPFCGENCMNWCTIEEDLWLEQM